MKYQTIFNLSVTHPYFDDEMCSDFRIEPDAPSCRNLERFRCVFRPNACGAGVRHPLTDDGSPLVALPDRLALTFSMVLTNPAFSLYTDLAEFRTMEAPLFMNRDTMDEPTLRLSSWERRLTDRLTVTSPTRGCHYALKNKPRIGIGRSDITISRLGRRSKRPTAYDERSGMITVDTRGASTGDTFEATYPIPSRLPSGVFAQVLVIVETKRRPATETREFTIPFSARSARWHYYVVSDRIDGTFSIVDQGPKPVAFSPANRTHLNKSPDPSDRIAESLADSFPDLERFRFVSDTAIPIRRIPRRQLQLRIKGIGKSGEAGSSARSVGKLPLPNPSLKNLVSAPLQGGTAKDDALYQIVECFNRSLKQRG